MPRRPGDLYLVGTASWEGEERGDASWFSHLELRKQERHTNIPSWPDMTLFTGGRRQVGNLAFASCWTQSFSDGTGMSMCYGPTLRTGPRRAIPARAGTRAYVRIHERYRPERARVRFQRQLSEDYYPTGPARRVPYRWSRVTSNGKTIAWDLRFRLPRRPGHLYPTVYAKWDQGSVTYEWHLRLR